MIKFTDNLITNVKFIDDQHKELFSRINEVIALGTKFASKEETDRTIKMLGDYIVKHFDDEEALQRKYSYPKHNEHKAMHQQYIAEFVKLKAEYDNNGPSVNFTMQLNKSIIDWIVKHIRYVDVDMGKFISEKS